MTPSGWHDDARNRDAGHDEMQVGIWNFLRQRDVVTLPVASPYGSGTDLYTRKETEVEKPFIAEGRITCFADICETFAFDEKRPHSSDTTRRWFYRVLEVKPNIYSVGAVLRQCAALELAIKTWKPSRDYFMRHQVWVIPACRPNDKKLDLLCEVCEDVCVWDGEVLTFRRRSK